MSVNYNLSTKQTNENEMLTILQAIEATKDTLVSIFKDMGFMDMIELVRGIDTLDKAIGLRDAVAMAVSLCLDSNELLFTEYVRMHT